MSIFRSAPGLCAAAFMLAGLSGNTAPASAADWVYMDDRSTPQKLIESYYYAISNRYYVQAYSYFQGDAAPSDFEAWAKGYEDTDAVRVKFGPTEADHGAGQIYWALPVALAAHHTDGKTVVYTGCYEIHMINMGMQTDPPYQPMGIVSASLKEAKTSYDKAVPGGC